jgi:ABC-2 type transport system permease protein
VLVGQFGQLLHLAGWVLELSPFSHVPSLPGAAFDVAGALNLVALSVLAVTLGIVAAIGIRRRDIV